MYSKDEMKKLRLEFWENFGKYTSFYGKKVGSDIKWILYKTGIKGLELKFDLQKHYIQVILEFNHKDEERNLDLYIDVQAYRSIIESGFENSLIWNDSNVENGFIKISVEKKIISYYSRENWPDIFAYMASNMYLLQENLRDILEIMQEKYNN